MLARLTSESCGLRQNELFHLFCQTLREFFGASGVCCCRTAPLGGWRILESLGHPTWGAGGEILSSGAAESLAQAPRGRNTILCSSSTQETHGQQGDHGLSQIAVPFQGHDEFLGAALVVWKGTADIT